MCYLGVKWSLIFSILVSIVMVKADRELHLGLSVHTVTLKVCSLSDSHISGYRNPKKFVIILRKKYSHHPGASTKKFSRVLANSNELIAEIKSKFKTANVTSFNAEDFFSLCP